MATTKLISLSTGVRTVFFSTHNGTFINQTTYSTGNNPNSVTTADVNGDNKTDLIVANDGSNTVSVLFNTQRNIPIKRPIWPQPELCDNSRCSDLIVANSNTVSVLFNTGNGTFINQTTYSTGTNPNSVTTADVNGDNKTDLIVANDGSNTVSVLLNTGNGTFINQTTYSTFINQNRSYWGSNTVSVLLNTGNGTFINQTTYSTGNNPNSVTTADVNGDNKTDLIVANDGSNTVSVLLNTGNGTFINQTTYSTGPNPRSVTTADVNGDNKTDSLSQTTVRTPLVFFSTQATEHSSIKLPIQLAPTLGL